MKQLAGFWIRTYTGSALFSLIFGVVCDVLGYIPMFVSWAVLSLIGLIVLPRVKRQAL